MSEGLATHDCCSAAECLFVIGKQEEQGSKRLECGNKEGLQRKSVVFKDEEERRKTRMSLQRITLTRAW